MDMRGAPPISIFARPTLLRQAGRLTKTTFRSKVLRQAGENNPKSYEMEMSDGNGASGCDDGAAYNIQMGGIYGESAKGLSFVL